MADFVQMTFFLNYVIMHMLDLFLHMSLRECELCQIKTFKYFQMYGI